MSSARSLVFSIVVLLQIGTISQADESDEYWSFLQGISASGSFCLPKLEGTFRMRGTRDPTAPMNDDAVNCTDTESGTLHIDGLGYTLAIAAAKVGLIKIEEVEPIHSFLITTGTVRISRTADSFPSVWNFTERKLFEKNVFDCADKRCIYIYHSFKSEIEPVWQELCEGLRKADEERLAHKITPKFCGEPQRVVYSQAVVVRGNQVGETQVQWNILKRRIGVAPFLDEWEVLKTIEE